MKNSQREEDWRGLSKFLQDIASLSAEIVNKKPDLISILCQYESYETALDEIDRSLQTLKGLETELSMVKSFKRHVAISVFFPINLPLYSLVLFAVAPSIFSEKIFVRPPVVSRDILKNIVECIRLDSFIKNVGIYRVSRRDFLDFYVSNSSAIIFNGRYENVKELIEEFPEKIFIYNGRGINPAIVGENANIDLAIDKIIAMRVFNSGQDCAGVDAIFVADNSYKRFVSGLKKRIPSIPVGEYVDPNVRIGKVQRPDYILELEKFLQRAGESVTLRGSIDKEKNIVTPFVVEGELSRHQGDLPEFFSPIFFILRYRGEAELLEFLRGRHYSDYAMYASVFGTSEDFNVQVPNTRILKDKNINDIENGNDAYGGYGPKANFVYRQFRYKVGPILISRELSAL